MDKDGKDIGSEQSSGTTPRHPWRRVMSWTAGVMGGLLVLLALGVCGLCWYLTPERLTRLVNAEASGRLRADVRIGRIDYTLWSTFPRLCVTADSVSVRSRTLNLLDAGAAGALPAGADSLLQCRRLQASLNLPELLTGDIHIYGAEADSLNLNLVAVNDSVNNFDIFPESLKHMNMPSVTIDTVALHGARVRFADLPSHTGVSADITRVGLNSFDPGRYLLFVDGSAGLSVSDGEIFNHLPFALEGLLAAAVTPLGLKTDDLSLRIGDLSGRVALALHGDDVVTVDKFDFRLVRGSVGDLLRLVPRGMVPRLDRMSVELPLSLSAHLSEPFDILPGRLPSATADFVLPDGSLTYTDDSGQRISVRNVGLSCHARIDGRHPERSVIEIPAFNLAAYDAEVQGRAHIVNPFGNMHVDSWMRCEGDLHTLSGFVAALKDYDIRGRAGVDIEATAEMTDNGSVAYDIGISGGSSQPRVRWQGGRASASSLRFSTDGHACGVASPSQLVARVLPGVTMTARDVRLSMPQQAVGFSSNTVTARALVSVDTINGFTGGGMAVRTDMASFSVPGAHGTLSALDLKLKLGRNKKPRVAKPYAEPLKWHEDSVSLDLIAHSPRYLSLDLPTSVDSLMRLWDARADIRLGTARFRIDGYNVENMVEGLVMSASNDTVCIRDVAVSSGSSGGHISALVTNLRQFLTTRGPAPLYASLNLRLDTIQCNHLARAYVESNPGSAIARGDKEAMAAGIDTVAVIIPRNLVVDLHATADQTRYINLHLYDLLADVHIADGVARVDTVRIGSDFGHAGMNMIYDTSDLQNLNTEFDVSVDDVSVVGFFHNFKKLLLKMPEMKDLSGMLGAHMHGRLIMFPDMYVDVPSVWADAHVRGWDLCLKQDKFVRHVTRMLMIRDDGALNIADIDIHAGVHSNLLEVFPFTFEMNRYKLAFEGLNNFAGDLYYHIGVEDWPLKIPFGVNIKGTFRHPKLRFGGKRWHDRNGAAVAAGVMDWNLINVVRETRRSVGELVHTAAVYREGSED